MDKEKILRLCNDIEDEVTDIAFNSTHKHIYDCCESIREYLKAIAAEITTLPKSNSDCIRQMEDKELAKFLDITCGCSVCFLNATAGECTGFKSSMNCIINKMKWLKQDASKNVGTDLLGTEGRMKMTYNTISLLDKEGQVKIFGIMKITLKEHLEQAIQRGCELCKEHGADGFKINYFQDQDGFPCKKSVHYDVHGNEISVDV